MCVCTFGLCFRVGGEVSQFSGCELWLRTIYKNIYINRGCLDERSAPRFRCQSP